MASGSIIISNLGDLAEKVSKSGDTMTGGLEIFNDSELKLLELRNQSSTSYARMLFTGNQRAFTVGVGNSAAPIQDIRNKWYVYDFTNSLPIFYGDKDKFTFSGKVGVATATENGEAVNKGQMDSAIDNAITGFLEEGEI